MSDKKVSGTMEARLSLSKRPISNSPDNNKPKRPRRSTRNPERPKNPTVDILDNNSPKQPKKIDDKLALELIALYRPKPTPEGMNQPTTTDIQVTEEKSPKEIPIDAEPMMDLLSTYQLSTHPPSTPNRIKRLRRTTRRLEHLIPIEFRNTSTPLLYSAISYINTLQGYHQTYLRQWLLGKELAEKAIQQLVKETELTRARYEELCKSNQAVYTDYGYHLHDTIP